MSNAPPPSSSDESGSEGTDAQHALERKLELADSLTWQQTRRCWRRRETVAAHILTPGPPLCWVLRAPLRSTRREACPSPALYQIRPSLPLCQSSTTWTQVRAQHHVPGGGDAAAQHTR